MRPWYKWLLRLITPNWLLKPNGCWSGIIAIARTVLVLLWLVGMGGCDRINSLTPSDSQDHLWFYDDFSDPQRGWQQWESEQAKIVNQEGGLRFSINAPYYDYWSLAGIQIEDAILAVEARVVGGPLNNDFGLICRYQNPGQFYAFIISSDGYAGIAVVDEEGYHLLTGTTLTYFASLERDRSTYLLRADCIGPRLTLYVDREKLLETEDHRYNSGDVGVFAGTFDQVGVEVIFDNFYVFKP
ncbi:hypothetical protein [Thermanaerothrix sp.]|uniref:hypothetical protein n=1 Tax=Thermanaerothrix sp. TaxID=2972675 RepID=UPI003C7D4830